MKKTQITDALRLIRTRKAAFLTLTLIIALGLGGFFAAKYAEAGMKQILEQFCRDRHFWDFRLVSPYGAGSEDVNAVARMPGIREAEGVYSAEGLIRDSGSGTRILAVSLTEKVSVPLLLSGSLPAGPDECAVEPDLLKQCGFSIGDVLEIDPADSIGPMHAQYRITGTVLHPDYIRKDTANVVVLTPDAFRAARFSSIIAVAAGTENADPFTDTYYGILSEPRQRLLSLAESLRDGLPESLADQISWMVLDRKANAGFVSYSSQARTYSSVGTIFGVLFLLVAALECFSTLTVIVEEEKRTVGVSKAFGFRRGEILRKYVSFGIGAALAGSALAVLVSLGLSRAMLLVSERTGLYVINAVHPRILPLLTLGLCLTAIVLCTAVSSLTCLNLLKTPAELLLKGSGFRTGSMPDKMKKYRRGSLYFRMILRNMRSDCGRVLLSVIIVTVSCILIGSGITTKIAHDSANNRQLTDVLLYDLRVGSGQADATVRAALEEKLDALNVEWCPVAWEEHLFDNSGSPEAVRIVCGDFAQIRNMIALTDPETGKEVRPGDADILAQYRMMEKLSLRPGDSLTVYDGNFRPVQLPVSGWFVNYSERMLIMSREAYGRIFGTGPADSSWLIRLGGVPEKQLLDELRTVSDDLNCERSDAFYEQYKLIAVAYNMVVLSITAIAVLISFVILINLAGLYIVKKKKELVNLRMNGFTLRMTKAYVMYEAIFTTAAGLVLGVLAGIPVASLAVRMMEKNSFQFVRDIQPAAWIIAVAVEAFFTLVIYSIAMRGIRNYRIEDLSGK